MFSIESYLTPYIAAYLGKYVDNFNKSNFQVSLWEGGATFQNVDLNLGAIEAELQIPFQVISGHIHELKISVPWTKITSEPIVVTINTFELSVRLKPKAQAAQAQVSRSQPDPSLPPDTTGYMQGLMNKIIQNAKIVCHNVILKYLEDDFVISFNFENVTLCSVNECWEQAFVDVGGTDFIVRRKLTCPDLTVCLDHLYSISRHSFMEPVLYKCAFDVRIFNQFQSPFSRVPFFRRLDILFNDVDVCILDEQIPMIMRLYNFVLALTMLKSPGTGHTKSELKQQSGSNKSEPDPLPVIQSNQSTETGCQVESAGSEKQTETNTRLPSGSNSKLNLAESGSNPEVGSPTSVTIQLELDECGCETEIPESEEGFSQNSSLYDWASWAVGWIPVPNILGTVEPEPPPPTPIEVLEPLIHIGLYVKSATVIMKTIDRICDRGSTTGSTTSSRLKTVPFLKCQIHGICCDIVVQGPARSVRGGISQLNVDGIGYCPCGLNDCIDETPQFPISQTCGITYFSVGKVNDRFGTGTLFDPHLAPSTNAYECRFHCKGYEDIYSEENMLEHTPGIALDSVEILPYTLDVESGGKGDASEPGTCCDPLNSVDNNGDEAPPVKSDSNFLIAFEQSGAKTSTRLIVAPFRLKVSTGFVHRVKVVYQAVLSYKYPSYSSILDLDIPDLRFFVKLRMDRFQCLFYDGDTGLIKDASHQIVMEVNGIKTNVDVKDFYKKHYFQVRSMNIRQYKRRTDSGDWDLGECLGFIMSSGVEIQPEIHIAKSSTECSSAESLSSVSSVITPSSHPTPPKTKISKLDDRAGKAVDSFFAFSYTQVQAAHYHSTSVGTDITTNWNKVVEGKRGTDSESIRISSDQEKSRYFAELDMKIKPMDFVISPSVLSPFIKLSKEILSVALHQKDSTRKPVVQKPLVGTTAAQTCWNSSNLPLAYLNAGKIRVFLKTDSAESPDTLVIQIPSTSLTSQVDNPLHRHCLRPDLLAYAEEAGVTMVPGSFFEDRRYEFSLRDLSISTCTWVDVEANSMKLITNPSIYDVISLKVHQEFEPSIGLAYSVISQPLLDKFELSVSFSPALMFNPVGSQKPILVSGYGGEMNFNRELHITANAHQLALVYGLYLDLNGMKCRWDSASSFIPDPSMLPLPEKDLQDPTRSEASSIKEVDSGVESSNIPHLPTIQVIPMDMFVAATSVRITTYDLVFKGPYGKSMEQVMDTLSGVKPLIMLNVIRPYFICSMSSINQKMEFSVFDITVGMGTGSTRLADQFVIPTKFDFPIKLFETLPGERNPKTGMIRPFITCTALDFLFQQAGLKCDIARPVKFVLSKERLHHFKELHGSVSEHIISSSAVSVETPEEDKMSLHKIVRFIASYSTRVQLSVKQVVVVVLEEPPGLPKAAITASITGFDVGFKGTDSYVRPADSTDRTTIDFNAETVVISTLIGDRTDVFLNPCGMRLRLIAEWHSYMKVPMSAISFSTDAITIFFGPQNILAFLQVYHTFGVYLMRFIVAEEEELVEILEARPTGPTEEVIFLDDLRNGTFHYIYSVSSSEMPSVYQVSICREHRTMTWRYPNPRTVNSITTHPVPILESSYKYSKNDQPVELLCNLVYWDEAHGAFLTVGTFVVTESGSEFIKFRETDGTSGYASTIWRITIQTPMEEEELKVILTPDGLASSLGLNSVFAPNKVPKVTLIADVPRIAVHFVNHRSYAGKIPEERLRLYTMDGLNAQVDQTFATFEISAISVAFRMWLLRAQADVNCFIRATVTDYSYLTDVVVIDPCSLRFRFSLVEDEARKMHQSMSLLVNQPAVVKVGASTLHTVIMSTLTWMQVLKAYYGDVVDTSKCHFQTHVNMTQILICNDSDTDLGIIQVDTKKPLVVYPRHCYAFTWTTQKVKPEVRVGIPEEASWKKNIPFSLMRCGTIARMLLEHHIFITTENLYASQMLVTISGSFTVANALEIPLEVGLFASNMNKESTWTVESRSHGPSRLIHARDVMGIRFRFTALNGKHHGWSHSLTIEELRTSPKNSKCTALYEESGGGLSTYNIWCSLVEETLDGACRCLIILSPIFRLRSLLSSPTIAKIGTAKDDGMTSFDLPGRGAEIEVDFVGDDTLTHLLTFQTDLEAQCSSPAIPLVPGGGPCIENIHGVQKRSINEILKDITLDFGFNQELMAKWPFTRESFDVRQWLGGNYSEPTVKVTFKQWIPGLPSVLVEAKPEAIFANLTGFTLLYREDEEDASILNRSAFSPKSIRGKFAFGFNCFARNSKAAIWSEELQITENQSPSDIHHVNSDWKIPLNSFSRLEIDGLNMQIHLTIETILYDGILILTLRPTFNIQNRTKFPFFACGISLHEHRVPPDELLGLNDSYIALDPNEPETENASETAIGLLLFNCDWNPVERNIYTAGMKYIGLQYSTSPWWFVGLMKFEKIFDNLSAPQGIPVKRLEVSIPSCQPDWVNGLPTDLVEVALPLSICWTCKNGQVWISVALDESPQVVIVNESQIPLCYVEAGGDGNGPQVEYEHFPQFRCLAPYTTGFYAFPSLQATFPAVMNSEPTCMLVLGLPAVHYKNVRRLTMLYRDPESIEWSTPVKCDGFEEVQLIPFGTGPTKVYLKVLTEKLGLSYYVYVEELSEAEVSARDVRARILAFDSEEECAEDPLCSLEHQTVKVRFTTPLISHVHLYDRDEENRLLTPDQLVLEIMVSNAALQVARPSSSKSRINIPVGTNVSPFCNFHLHLPEIRLIFTDDLTQLGQKREILSLIITDIFAERHPRHGERPLRVLGNNRSESWVMCLRVGDIQLDNALFQEKRYDFPVLLKRNDSYESSLSVCGPYYEQRDFMKIFQRTFENQRSLVEVEADFLITSPDVIQTLQSIDLKCESFTVNIEDKFIAFIFPVFENLVSIVTERLALLQAETEILQAQRQEHHSNESSGISLPEKYANQKPKTSLSLPGSSNLKPIVEILPARRLSYDESSISSRAGPESPGLRSRSNEEDENDSLRIHHSIISTLTETVESLTQGPLYTDIGEDYLGKLDRKHVHNVTEEDSFMEIGKSSAEEFLSPRLLQVIPSHRAHYMPIPLEIVSIIRDLARPIQMERIHIHQIQTYLTFRGRYRGMYFAFDNSPILLSDYLSKYVVTTAFTLGETFGNHYLLGAIYRRGNPMRIIGSLELIGSPGTLARSVGSGFKDFVVYPVRGIRNGPLAFVTGLNNGCTSLVRNVSSGTLTSLTNFAWSVSRNIDKLTLDQQEQLFVEETRRVPIDGISDGLLHGLTGFGIRLLGAIGGMAHHPIQAVMEEGASPLGIVTGIGKGLIGVVTKPVGATVELVAMTGQGLLQEAGWAHKFKRKYEVFLEETLSSPNALLKYRWKLGLLDRDPGREKLLMVVDAVEPGRNSKLTPVSIVITTENVYVMDTTLDQVQRKDSISSTIIKHSDFVFDPISGPEFFNLLKLAKRIQEEDVFGTFSKISTNY